MSEPFILLEAPRPFAMTYSPNRDPFLEQIATTLKQRGLHSVALTLLEGGQPLAFVGSQLLWLAQPALALLWPAAPVRQFAQLMEDPATVSELMARLAADEARV
jgi:hypothetical protein